MHSGRRRTRQMRQSNYSLKRTESLCKASYRKNALVISLFNVIAEFGFYICSVTCCSHTFAGDSTIGCYHTTTYH